MAKLVGLSRNIKLQWLNKTVQLLDENLSETEFKNALNEYLSYEIKSETNLRKTREILMRIWFYSDPDVDEYRKAGRALIAKYPDESMCVHWCMMLLVYPVFADLSKFIGRIAELQDTVVLAQLKKKLFDEWGERTTLFHSIDKIVSTMKELDALRCEKVGKYIVPKHTIEKDELISYLIWCVLKVDGNSYYSFVDLNAFNMLFPFEYAVGKEQLMLDDRFSVTPFDGQLTVALKD